MEADFLTEEHLIEPQRTLALADIIEDRPENRLSSEPTRLERLVARFGHVKVQMYEEHGPHKRPHFHIEYKRQYRASYSIDTLERIVGYMPKNYERPVLDWAKAVQPHLVNSWEQLARGGPRVDIEIDVPNAPQSP
jgi:hypothetical protein